MNYNVNYLSIYTKLYVLDCIFRLTTIIYQIAALSPTATVPRV